MPTELLERPIFRAAGMPPTKPVENPDDAPDDTEEEEETDK